MPRCCTVQCLTVRDEPITEGPEADLDGGIAERTPRARRQSTGDVILFPQRLSSRTVVAEPSMICSRGCDSCEGTIEEGWQGYPEHQMPQAFTRPHDSGASYSLVGGGDGVVRGM